MKKVQKYEKMKVLFIDRDGTLIHEPSGGYINSLKKFKILPHVVQSLKKLQQRGYKFIMISNQPGLGTDKLSHKNFLPPQNKLMEIFNDNNILFDGTYFCPHFREDNCSCMKPKTGLIDDFLSGNNIDLTHSYVIGDRKSDIILSKNIGCKSIFYSNQSHTNVVFCSKNWKKISEYILKNSND